MKFKYLITNTTAGYIFGTDDAEAARRFARSETYYVADVANGIWMSNVGSFKIPELSEPPAADVESR